MDDTLEGEIHVTVIATGFENGQQYKSEKPSFKSINKHSITHSKKSNIEYGAKIPEFLRQRQQNKIEDEKDIS